jgi:hypothetical protein
VRRPFFKDLIRLGPLDYYGLRGEPSRAQYDASHSVFANFGNQAGAGGALSSSPCRAVMFGLRPFMGGSVKIMSRCCRKTGSYSKREGRLNRLNSEG